MAKDHAAKEKAIMEYLGFSWIRDQKWDGEGTAFDGEEWYCEAKSANLPGGCKGIWRILDEAWAQILERMAQQDAQGHALVAYVPTHTASADGLAMFVCRGQRVVMPLRKFRERYITGAEEAGQ